MPIWKRNIMVRGIMGRMLLEGLTREDILETYTKLTEDEKNELREHIPEELE